ncbi:Zinc finger UBR-type [Trinorchestia longiramus]|nr:Zinc finger UBR-type [Trinorchestia longiramus]
MKAFSSRRYGVEDESEELEMPLLKEELQGAPPLLPQYEKVVERPIREGETLLMLALNYRISVSELKRVNRIQRDSEFHALSNIKIPVKPHSELNEILEAEANEVPQSNGLSTNGLPGRAVGRTQSLSSVRSWSSCTAEGEDCDSCVGYISIQQILREKESRREARHFLENMRRDLARIKEKVVSQKPSLDEAAAALTDPRFVPLTTSKSKVINCSVMEESVEDIVQNWLRQHKESTLTNRSFREYWRKTVPLIYAPQPNLNPMHLDEQEEQSTKQLTDPLHQFIAGSSTPDNVYSSIRELDAAPSLCGYVFNAGEPTYGCRDCGFDPTCVLCSDCFKASPHTKHRYKMSTSSGGGYCDCGDTEAWRSDAFCDVHAKGTQGISMSSHKQLDPDLVSRIQVVIECIIDYVRDMLTLSEGLSLPSDLELPDAEPTRNPNLFKMQDAYCAVLYNDESHTYDQVIAALERAIKCSKKEAVAYVTFIDREGRCVIRCSGFQDCQLVKSAMDRQAISQSAKPFIVKVSQQVKMGYEQAGHLPVRQAFYCEGKSADQGSYEQAGHLPVRQAFYCEGKSADQGSYGQAGHLPVRQALYCEGKSAGQGDYGRRQSPGLPFIGKIFRSHIQAHQSFASHLLMWLDKLLERGNAIKAIFAEIIFSCPSGDSMTLLERIMWTDNDLCKATRIQWHKLFISGLLMDFETKKRFARLFTKHYSKMMKTFIADDHEHSVCIVSLGVQLFTMPTIAHMLIAEEAVIAKLILTFITECTTRIKNGKLFPLSQSANVSHLEQGSMTPNEFRRVQFILFDLKYLLGMVPITWTDQLRKGFLHGFNQIVKLFCMMQNMDPVTRKEGTHVEFEQEWEGSFNLHIKMSPIIPQLVEWAASDRVVLIKAMRMLLKALCEHGCDGLQKRFMREAAGHTVSCIEYDVSKCPVSMHVPLTRLCGFLSVQLQKYNLSFNSQEFPTKDKPSLKELIEPSLRTLVMVSQCKAGMWRRNGMSLTNQTYFYRNVRCRQEMLDRDVLVLQNAAALMEPNDFLICLLNRFNLMSWQRPDYEATYLWSRDEDNIHQTVVILEEFLQLLLYILAERYVVGVAEVTAGDVTKHEVIHLLCVQNMTHSSINKQLPEGTNHETGMEQIIDEIAEFKKPSGDVKGYHELRAKYYDMYNIFFYHYSKEEQSKSEVEHRERCKKLGKEVCCPPPPVPPFTPAFSSIRNILNSPVFRHLVRQVFSRWSDERSRSVTETSVQVCLHLMGIACYEEERTPGFLVELSELWQQLQVLQGNNTSATVVPLINWTKNK